MVDLTMIWKPGCMKWKVIWQPIKFCRYKKNGGGSFDRDMEAGNIHMGMYEMNSDMGADRYKKSFIFMRWGGRFYRDVEVGYV